MNETLGIYLHMPFCLRKCPYCDFYSLTDAIPAEQYVTALLNHMDLYQRATRSYDIDTLYIGGGTPTLLPIDQMERLVDGIYARFHVTRDAEFTIECNPATADLKKLKKLHRLGINRLSIGLQSANHEELTALGRIHSYDDFLTCFEEAKKAGFQNISVDLMYGIPKQTKESFRQTLEKVTALEPNHLSIYGLKIEEGTPFAKAEPDQLPLPCEDDECDMYFDAIDFLKTKGYRQYEISNFARPGFSCLHNRRYWDADEYLGFGPAAHSYFGGRRFAYRRDLRDYIRCYADGDTTLDVLSEDYAIKESERLGEYVMLRLRLTDGIDTDEFKRRFGIGFEQLFEKFLPLYCENGFMEKDGRIIRFTAKGMYVSNYILSAMLDFQGDMTGDMTGCNKA